MNVVKYKKGGSKKYVLLSLFVTLLKVKPKRNIQLKYASLTKSGTLHIYADYEWDGPSGPAIDTNSFMRGSLVHDLLYQLIREGHLGSGFWSRAWYRLKADNEMFRQCGKGKYKMIFPRRCWTWLGVRIGGYWSARR